MSLSREFAEKLHRNLSDGVFVDFKLLCDGETIDVHKIILCSYSPVFLTVLLGSYKEQDDSMYEIKDSSYSHVLAMVTWMYTASYEAPTEDPTPDTAGISGVLFHARMVALADKYLIPTLHELASSKFKSLVDSEEYEVSLLRCVPGLYAIEAEGSAELRRILVSRFNQPHSRKWYGEASG